MTASGISLEKVRDEVKQVIGFGSTPTTGNPPYTPRAKKVLEFSLREALQLGHNYVGTEHILLGLIREGEGVAAQTLMKLGAELDITRQKVIGLLSGYQKTAAEHGYVHQLLQHELSVLNIRIVDVEKELLRLRAQRDDVARHLGDSLQSHLSQQPPASEASA